MKAEHENCSSNQKADPSKIYSRPSCLTLNSDRMAKLEFSCYNTSSSA